MLIAVNEQNFITQYRNADFPIDLKHLMITGTSNSNGSAEGKVQFSKMGGYAKCC